MATLLCHEGVIGMREIRGEFTKASMPARNLSAFLSNGPRKKTEKSPAANNLLGFGLADARAPTGGNRAPLAGQLVGQRECDQQRQPEEARSDDHPG